MKEHTQTIINVCFAISITAFIYQNNSLKDDVETLKGYAQLDTDKAGERMDDMEDNIKAAYINFEQQNLYNKELERIINSNVEKSEEVDANQEILIETVENIRNYVNDHETEIDELERSIKRLPKPKTTGDIKSVIQRCKVDTYAMSGPMITNMHGHKTIKC